MLVHALASHLHAFHGLQEIVQEDGMNPGKGLTAVQTALIFFVAPVGDRAVTLGGAVGAWKTWTSHALRRALKLEGPVWERQFFDHLLRSDESRAEKWHYVRENPVRAGLVTDVSAWPYAGAVDFD